MSDAGNEGAGLQDEGISLQAFVTALAASLVVFGVQSGLFLLLRNKLSRIL
jgi:calcium permeable stress-gated cation channel